MLADEVVPRGHLQVKRDRRGRGRSYWAFWHDATGKHGKRLGPAHVKDSGRRTARGAVVWRVGDGQKPSAEHLTPKEADARLAEILNVAPRRLRPQGGGTLEQAVEGMIAARASEEGLKRSTRADYANMAARLYRDLGADTPVVELDPDPLRAYISGFEAERPIGPEAARKARADGRSVRQVTNVHRYASPPGQEPVEVATITEARRIADERGWTFKHRRRGVYRVTPPNGRRPRRVGCQEAEQLAAQGWTIRMRSRTHWVLCGPASAQTRNKYRDFIGAAMDWAMDRGWLNANPIDSIPRAGRRGERERVLRREDFYEPSEVERLLAATADDFERAFFLCGFHAGLRLPGEALGLTWGAVDFAADVIRPYGNWVLNALEDETKTGRFVPIPMTPSLKTVLQRLKKRNSHTGDHDHVFTRDPRGLPVDGADMRELFRQLIQRVGLKPIPMYNTRHSFGTGLARAGVDVRTISGLMRHRRLSTTEIYMAYAPQPELQERLSRALEAPSGAALVGEEISPPNVDEDRFWTRLEEELPAKWVEVVRDVLAECSACRSRPPAIAARSPKRSASVPVRGATRNMAAPQGSSRSPASMGP